MNTYTVYLITNKINDKKYVGITRVSVESRLKNHFRYRTKEQCTTKFNYAVLKYGVDNFTVSILETHIPKEKADEKERYYISLYNSYKNGYNSTVGGSGTVGYVFTEEDRKKMSNSWNRDKIITPERNNKISNALKGVPKCLSTRQKLSKSKRNYYKTHINQFKGKHHSLESKLKMRYSSSIYGVQMLNRTTEEVIRTFETMMDACEWIKQEQKRETPLTTIRYRISEFIRGKRSDGSHAIYGYKWKYIQRVRCND